MSFVDDIINFLVSPIKTVCPSSSCIPVSTVIVIIAAVLVALITNGANRLLVNYKLVANSRREHLAWVRAIEKARKDEDRERLNNLLKQRALIMKTTSRATLEQLKGTALTIIPVLIIYGVLFAAFPLEVAVAFSPMYIPGAAVLDDALRTSASFLSVIYWYPLCSFAIGIPLSRLFGIQQQFSLNPPDTSMK